LQYTSYKYPYTCYLAPFLGTCLYLQLMPLNVPFQFKIKNKFKKTHTTTTTTTTLC